MSWPLARSCPNRAWRASLALLIAAASGPPPATASEGWCHALPLEKAFCQALLIAAPRGALRVAIADTEARREHGLMNVPAVPLTQGMLFVFPDGVDARRDFWMKDTIAPLDMIFIRNDGTVSAVAANVPATKPGTRDDRVARRAGIGRYVLELGAGGARRAGLDEGTVLTLPPLTAR